METKLIKLSELRGADYNPRKELKPGDPEFEKLKHSIETWGVVEPIIWNRQTNTIVGGHQRLSVLRELGYEDTEVVVVDLDEANEKALNIALNKISGDWDAEKLEDLLRELDNDTDIDVTLTGFDLDELDTLYSGAMDDLNDVNEHISNEAKQNRKEHAGGLLKKFAGFAPFSVLDSSSKTWQNRKKEWLDIGIKSELGRDAACINIKKVDYLITNKTVNYTSIFDPVLCEICYRWFCIKGGSILDPFAGGSVRGVVASELGYSYTGIDLRQEQIDSNYENYKQINNNENYILADKANYEISDPLWICDDSKNIDEHADDASYDMIFTCPPYADLEKYSNSPKDLSNMNYDGFIKAYEEILVKTINKLKNNRFAIIVVGEVRSKSGEYYNFVGDTINIMKNKCGLQYYNEMILVTPNGNLGITCGQAMNKSRKVGKKHQNILVFYKGDASKIREDFGDVVDAEEIDKQIKESSEEGDING